MNQNPNYVSWLRNAYAYYHGGGRTTMENSVWDRFATEFAMTSEHYDELRGKSYDGGSLAWLKREDYPEMAKVIEVLPFQYKEIKILEGAHPGVIIQLFLGPKELNANALAKATHMELSIVEDLLQGRSNINVDIALRLAYVFNTAPEYWLNLQNSYDLISAVANFNSKTLLELSPL